eukprot:4090540-Pleurochrysis_carterae.AAC.4
MQRWNLAPCNLVCVVAHPLLIVVGISFTVWCGGVLVLGCAHGMLSPFAKFSSHQGASAVLGQEWTFPLINICARQHAASTDSNRNAKGKAILIVISRKLEHAVVTYSCWLLRGNRLESTISSARSSILLGPLSRLVHSRVDASDGESRAPTLAQAIPAAGGCDPVKPLPRKALLYALL